MINPKKIKKSEARHIVELVKQATKCEIIARLGHFDNLGFADYYSKAIEITDEIREYIFGTSDMVVLGERWGILKSHEEIAQEKRSVARYDRKSKRRKMLKAKFGKKGKKK